MKQGLLIFILSMASTYVFSQDVRVREEAVGLLEKADAVSTPLHLPNLERIDTFRVFGYDAPVRQGFFSRVVIQGTGRRDETTYGDYHVIDVFTSHGLTTVRTNELPPPEINDLMRLTPVFHGSFDDNDVIHSIVSRDVEGHPARCIEFDTVTGAKTQTNEICVDADNGALLIQKVGDERVDYRDYFPFRGSAVPGQDQLLIYGRSENGDCADLNRFNRRHRECAGSAPERATTPGVQDLSPPLWTKDAATKTRQWRCRHRHHLARNDFDRRQNPRRRSTEFAAARPQ
jgi:hypothetical protein